MSRVQFYCVKVAPIVTRRQKTQENYGSFLGAVAQSSSARMATDYATFARKIEITFLCAAPTQSHQPVFIRADKLY